MKLNYQKNKWLADVLVIFLVSCGIFIGNLLLSEFLFSMGIVSKIRHLFQNDSFAGWFSMIFILLVPLTLSLVIAFVLLRYFSPVHFYPRAVASFLLFFIQDQMTMIPWIYARPSELITPRFYYLIMLPLLSFGIALIISVGFSSSIFKTKKVE
jgi:hypothetical protein